MICEKHVNNILLMDYHWKTIEAVKKEKIEFQKHALKRMVEERLTSEEIINTIIQGEIIRHYHEDRPFPSVLILGYIEQRPIHVVCAYNHIADKVHVITNYEPTLDYYEDDFKTRR